MGLKEGYQALKKIIRNNPFLKKAAIQYSLRSSFLPRVVNVWLTSSCQCSCSSCTIFSYRKKNTPELSTAEVIDIIDASRRLQSIMQIGFTGGEPLLREDIFDLAAHAKKKGFFTKVDTNGILLDDEKLKKFKKIGLDRILIGMSHHEEEALDKFRGTPGSLKRILDNVALCRALKISCYLQIYMTKERLYSGELERMIQFVEKMQVERVKIVMPAMINTFRKEDGGELFHKDLLVLQQLLERHPAFFFESETFTPLDYRHFCAVNFKTNIQITSYGDVQPCYWMPVAFGNIREKGLKEILREMYAHPVFKRLTSEGKCLCNSKEFLAGYLKGRENLPVRAA